jgi:cell division protein FtsI (penicillin-binding protein 3)
MTGKAVDLRPGPWRRRVLLGVWLGAAVVVCVRAGQIQGVQASAWRAIAESQHSADNEVVATRGAVLDRDGTPLAVSRERFRVSVAPNELIDVDEARRLLTETLGISTAKAAQVTSSERSWHVVPDRFPPTVREPLKGVRGIHIDRELQRYHPLGDLARGVLGAVIDDVGQGGIEQAFEDLLRGASGREVIARDNIGRPIPGERYLVDPPLTGGVVVLTLDMDMQEIARQALYEAIATTQARGGDVLVTDPQTGEILALVSIRDGQTASLSAINTPYEPGSTLKPLTVAGLLEHDLASLDDTVDVGDGTWTINRRRFTETHVTDRMSLADALRRSSNIGIAKAALPMSPGVQYENLRDFGLGAPTGIEIPGEVAGTLRRPDRWSSQSPQSLAIGYEVGVTPLQMVMAYGALANGGRLMRPRLVKEIRGSDGSIIERFEPEVIREVVSPRVTRQVARVLVGVVEDGTGTSAQLGTFQVAGKSGTSRLYTPGVGYEKGAYWSSFVSFFPADDPQLVVFVKLESPVGAYYGGAVAAPVTRATMEAALAARATHLDRGALLRSVRRTEPAARPVTHFASQPIDPPAPPSEYLLEVGGEAVDGTVLTAGVPVPDLQGVAARTAVRRLHALGLRVSRPLSGEIVGTEPSAGTRVLPGDTVRLMVPPRTDND